MSDSRSQYSANYIEQYTTGGFETVLVQIRREQVLSFLRSIDARRIIEIGCGLEPLFLHWKSFDTMTIVEPSAEFVDRARQQISAERQVDIFQAYAEDIAPDLAVRNADAIVVSSLLHEVSDPQRLLAAVHTMCSPSTRVHFNVPNVRSFHRLLALEMGVIADLFEQSETEKRFHRHTRFDRARLETTLDEGGFDVLQFGTYFIKPFTHGQMEALLASGSIDGRVIEGLMKMTTYFPDMGCEMFANVRRR